MKSFRMLRSKVYIFCSETETKISTSPVKRSNEDEIETIFFKKDTYDPF